MPELSRFFGIVIAMYYRDHWPAHFHAIYGEFEVTVNIETGEVTGYFPRKALGHVQQWRRSHIDDLRAAWVLAISRQPLSTIGFLE